MLAQQVSRSATYPNPHHHFSWRPRFGSKTQDEIVRGVAGMEEVRALSHGTLALLRPTAWRRAGWLFDDRRLDRESIAKRLKAHGLLKLGEIKFLLVQVRPQLATAAQARNTANAKQQSAPQASKTNAIILRPDFSLLPMPNPCYQQGCGGDCSTVLTSFVPSGLTCHI